MFSIHVIIFRYFFMKTDLLKNDEIKTQLFAEKTINYSLSHS